MCEFCKRLAHIHEPLPFIRVNVEALITAIPLDQGGGGGGGGGGMVANDWCTIIHYDSLLIV